MATFKKTATGYRITDDAGHTVNLSIEQSYDLLSVLYNQRDQLFALVHDLPGDPWLADTETEQAAYISATTPSANEMPLSHEQVEEMIAEEYERDYKQAEGEE